MVKVFPLKDVYVNEFAKMFKEYYAELGCDDDTEHLTDEYIIPDVKAGLLKADLIAEGELICGFCLYQIDCEQNEWNFKPGCGDIREIYIIPQKRGAGLGKFLLYTVEMRLKESGAEQFYAAASGCAADFFAACGYELNGEICEELDCNILIKNAADCGCNCNNS